MSTPAEHRATAERLLATAEAVRARPSHLGPPTYLQGAGLDLAELHALLARTAGTCDHYRAAEAALDEYRRASTASHIIIDPQLLTEARLHALLAERSRP